LSKAQGWRSQFFRFALVGALCTAIQYLLLATGVEWLGADPVAASTVGYVVSAVFNYLLSRSYTFSSAASHGSLVWKYVVVLGSGLLLNGLFMQLLHGYLQWHYVPAQLVATGVVLFTNFWGHRIWTFSRSNPCD
jgi:putative flippase GtrA